MTGHATGEIRHTAKLPSGYEATFIWSAKDGIAVEWNPDVPRIKSPRAFRKFREAYNAARRAFYGDIATCIGGNVMIVDNDGLMEVVSPAPKH